jgi:serine protease Do
LGRLETSEDFKISEKQKPLNQENEIENLKITVRVLNKEDIKSRKLPNQTTGLVITSIANNSPLKNTTLSENDIIVEAQKKRIKSVNDLREITNQVLQSNQKTILLAIYTTQNQKRYIGVKLD